MKTVVVEKPIRDVDGLLTSIRNQDPEFGVVSVGTDARRTYIYLEDDEERDPTPFVSSWEDIPELRIASMNRIGLDKVPQADADGEEVHTVLIQKVSVSGELVEGSEKLHLIAPKGIPVSLNRPRLKEGTVTVTVGPAKRVGQFRVEVRDSKNALVPARVDLGFSAPQPQRVVAEEMPQDKEKALEKIHNILQI